MQVSNFDRTREKIYNELENRLFENKKNYDFQLGLFKDEFSIKEEVIVGRFDQNTNDIYDMESYTEMIFTFIENKTIGTVMMTSNSIFKTLNSVRIDYNKFEDCKFKNVKFENCTFYGTIFSNCKFQNVVFQDCSFFNSTVITASFENKSIFEDCSFKNCSMEKIIFKDSEFYNTKFILTNLRKSILSNIYLDSIYITDCDCRAFKIINSKIKRLEFEDNFLTKFNEDTFIDKIKIDKRDKKYFEDVSRVYKNIASKFESNRLPNITGEYNYLSKCMENKCLKGFSKIKSYIFWMLCGYGERPTYALITSIEIVLLFTIIYMFTGLSVEGEKIDYNMLILLELPIKNLISDFMKSLYFSIVTFTTVGYGDITPVGYSRILSGVEMALGVTMVGVWTATLARKITR